MDTKEICECDERGVWPYGKHKAIDCPFRPAPQGTPEKVYILKKDRPSIGKEIGDYYNGEFAESIEELIANGVIEEEIAPQKEKDPEPISAQIEDWEDRFDKAFTELNPDMGLNETMLFEPTTSLIKDFIRAEISTAHRNGVIEGKRENAIKVDEFFADGILHGTDVASKMIRETLIKQGAESMKAKAKEIVEKISVMVCYECDGGKELKEEILTALSQMDLTFKEK